MIARSIIVGTGFSGLCMAIKLLEKGIEDFIILEKSDRVGGTWRENTYPGAECDVPSALYSYSFEPYPDWEYKWSLQPQILKYINHVVDKYDLRKFIRFNHEVESARWDDTTHIWTVTTTGSKTYQAQSLVMALGQLHHPSVPKFNGYESLSIPHFHSAQWDHSIDLRGKKVGVIGNAASAVQFIPEIAKEAGELYVFQRSANWMLPKQDRLYKEWEKNLVRRFPLLLKLYRLKLWLLGGGLFFLMKAGYTLLRKFQQKASINYIKEHISDPDKIEKLTPDYPMGAKRILFSDTYYQALNQQQVHLITDDIQRMSGSMVMTTSSKISLDVLIFATGFKTNPFFLGLDIMGAGGKKIKKAWSHGPVNYLGMTTSGFPNFFMMYGPNTNLGHNSIIIMSEAQAGYIAQCIKPLSEGKFKSLDIKTSVMTDYFEKTQKRLNKMIWASVDKSWYKSADGTIPNNYPGRTMEYMRTTNHVNFDLYHVKY